MQHTAPKTSALLRDILIALEGETTTLEQVLVSLGRRSFGGVLVMLSALAIIPGVSVITGLLIMIVGIQMLLGAPYPGLPAFIRGMELDTENLRRFGDRVAQQIEWIERSVRPRWQLLTDPPIARLIALSVVILGAVMMIPLPLTNLGPAIAILVIAIGQLERDGVVIVAGLLIGLLAFAVALLALLVLIAGVKGVLT